MNCFSKAGIGNYIKRQRASRQAKECCCEGGGGGQVDVVGPAMNTTAD